MKQKHETGSSNPIANLVFKVTRWGVKTVKKRRLAMYVGTSSERNHPRPRSQANATLSAASSESQSAIPVHDDAGEWTEITARL